MNRKQAQQGASDFVARLYSGEMTKADEKALDSWLVADPDHGAEYDAALALWDRAEALRDNPQICSAGAPPKRLTDIVSVKQGIAAAFAFFIIALGAAMIYPRSPLSVMGDKSAIARYQTSVGERRDVTLLDGTLVTLNTDTKILVDYTDEQRRIILDYGEAFFDVVKDPARPLIVDAGKKTVTALGTKFNVYRTGREIRVAVAEGLVSVRGGDDAFSLPSVYTPDREALTAESSSPAANQTLLAAGDVASFTPQEDMVSDAQPEEVKKINSWRHGVVRFDNEPLYKVVGEINRYTEKKILIEDSRIMELSISGVFQLDRVENILLAMEAAFPIAVARYSDRYVVVSRES